MTTEISGSPARRLRRSFQWGLGATLVATLASLFWPTSAIVAVTTGHDAAMSINSRLASDGRIDHSPAAFTPLPLHAESASVAASSDGIFDPFAGASMTPIAAPPPPPVSAAPPTPPPPLPPPTQDYRYFGRVTGPDGIQQVLLGRGETSISVSKGTVLDNGYVVESISTDAVTLTYPSLGVRTSILIPSE